MNKNESQQSMKQIEPNHLAQSSEWMSYHSYASNEKKPNDDQENPESVLERINSQSHVKLEDYEEKYKVLESELSKEK